MGLFSSAVKWVAKKVVKPIVKVVQKATETVVDAAQTALEAAGNFVSGVLSTKFALSGTLEGTSGKDILVGLDLGSVLDFLKLSFSTLFSAEFWREGKVPDGLKFWEGKNNAGVTLLGGSGNDTLLGFGGAPKLDGGRDNDRLLALGGVNTLIGGHGDDTLVAAGVVNFVDAGDGDDDAIVLGGGNTVDGGAGDDTLTVFGLSNTIRAGSGRDLVVAVGGGNTIWGEAGADRIFVGGVVVNIVRGGADGDLIAAGGIGGNYLFGGHSSGSGTDTIVAIGGANFIYGDADPGAFDLAAASLGGEADADVGGNDVIVAFGLGNFIWAEGGNDIVVAFAGGQLIFGHAGDDKVVALGGANLLFGGDDDDVLVALGSLNALSGAEGDDTLVSFGGLDLGFGGAGDDWMVSVGPSVFGFQLGDTGSDKIVAVGGTVRVQFGDNPFDFTATDDRDENQAQRDGILGFVEQTLLDFQFTDFEFEDLSLPTLPSLDDIDDGSLEAAETFLEGAWEGTKGVFEGLGDILSLLDPARISFDGLETAWAQIEFDNFSAPRLAGIADALLPSLDLSKIGVGALAGVSAPEDPDLSEIEAVADPYAGIAAPTDVIGGASRLILPEDAGGSVSDKNVNFLPDIDLGFSTSFLADVDRYLPGETLNTGGLPDLSFGDLLDLPVIEIPDIDAALGAAAATLLPSDAAFAALGETFSGLAVNFEGAGLFQPGEGRGRFSLPDVSLPTLTLPNVDLYQPAGQSDDDILVSVAGASFLFGQEDDDIVVGAGLFNMLFGGDGADILAAIAKGNIVSGGEGDDIALAAGLMNYVSGGAGSDILGAGGKFNVVAGGTDADAMIAGGLANLMLGGSGRDLIASFGKFNLGVGGADGDILVGGGTVNVALGGGGDDLLAGGGKLNVMLGGNGRDLMLGGGKFNAQFGGRGADIAVGGGKFNLMDGDRGDDVVLGGGQFNVMYTRDGNDALIGGGKFNLMIAGGGTDFILGGGKFNVIMSGVEEDDADNLDHDIVLTGGSYNTFFAGAGDDLSVIGGKLNTTYLGTGQDIVLGFSGGLNTVFAQGDADIVIGAGTGTLYSGGTGNDLIFGFGKSPSGAKGRDSSGKHKGGTDARGEASVDIRGDWGDDLLIGTRGDVMIEGGDGQDRLFSSAKLSFLDGGAGYDFLFAASGLSALDGGTGNDVIVSRATNPDSNPDAAAEESAITDAAEALIVDGGDVQGGFGADLIFAHGTDLEVFGDLGSNVLPPELGGPEDVPQGETADTRDGDDYIIVSGSASQTYGGGGDDALILFGTGQVGDGGTGRDLMLAMGEGSLLRGGGGADTILQLGAGASAAYGDAGNDAIYGRGFSLLDWMLANSADVVAEFAANVALAIENIGDFIGSTIDSIGTFRGFDGSQVQEMAYFAGRDGLGALPTDATPTEEEIRQAEVEAAEAFIFNLVGSFGSEALADLLSQIEGGATLAPFAPSYETLGNEVSQLGRMQLTERTDEPDVSDWDDVNISVVVLQRDTAPIFSGGSGADRLHARLGVSTLEGNRGNDQYFKTVRERFTIIDEKGGADDGGGNDRLTIGVSAFSSADYTTAGGAGLTLDNLILSRANADLESAEANDLLIRTVDGAGDLASLTVLLDYFDADGRVETLILSDGATGDQSFDLAALAAGAVLEADAIVRAGMLVDLIAGDVAALDQQLSAFEAYTDVALYEDFDIVDNVGGTGDQGGSGGEGAPTYGEFESALDTYLRMLEEVEPGATATADAADLNDVLDGDAFAGAPEVQVRDEPGDALVLPGYTLLINRFEKDGYDWFDSSLVAGDSSDGFVPLFRTDDTDPRGPQTAVEITPRANVEARLTGTGEAPVYNDAQEIFDGFGFDGFDGPNDDVRSGTWLMQLGFVPGENPDLVDPVEVRGRLLESASGGSLQGVGLFLDLEDLEGVVPILSNFRYVWASGEGTLQLGSGNENVIGDRGDQVIRMGTLGNEAFGGGGDDRFEEITRDDRVWGGEGDDTFVLGADLRSQNNRQPILRGEEGADTYVIGPITGDAALESGVLNPRQVTIVMDADDVIDLSGFDLNGIGLRGKGQTSNLDTSFEIVHGSGNLNRVAYTQVDFTDSEALGKLRFVDGIERQIVDTYNTAAEGAGYAGGVALLPELVNGGTRELHGSAFGDVIVSNRYTTQVEAGDGDDFIFATRSIARINPGAGDDYIRLYEPTSNPGHVIEFDGSLFDYRIYRGFFELAVEHVPTGDLNRIDASIDAFGGVLNLDRLQFDDFSIDGADIVVGTVLDDSFTIAEDTVFDIGAEAAALMPEGTEEVIVSLNLPATGFGEIRVGAEGPLVWALGTVDAADLPDLVFVPDADLHSDLPGAPEEIRLDMDFIGPDGLLRTAHFGFEITPVADVERFGTPDLPTGGAIVLQEGEGFDVTTLFYDDPDKDKPDRFVEVVFDAGTTGVRWLDPTAFTNDFQPLEITSLYDRSEGTDPETGAPIGINQEIAVTELEIDENTTGTITFSARAESFNYDTNQFFDIVELPEITVTWEPVDDPEFFEGVPQAAKVVAENSFGRVFDGLSLGTVDAPDGATYEVHLESYVREWTLEGQFTEGWTGQFVGIDPFGRSLFEYTHPNGAKLTPRPDLADPDGAGIVHVVRGSFDQLDEALTSVWHQAPNGINYEGEVVTDVTLYKVEGEALVEQDAFTRVIEFEPDANAPILPYYYTVVTSADSGPVEIGAAEPFDPDFSDAAQPDWVFRVFGVPDDGRVELADGTVVQQNDELSLADYLGMVYVPDATGTIGARDSFDQLAFFVRSDVLPVSGWLTQRFIEFRVFDDKDLVPNGSGGTVAQLVGREVVSPNQTSPFDNFSSNAMIVGGDGDDTIIPGEGVDIMRGGAGADLFRFDAESGVFNAIWDFVVGLDDLEFDGLAVVEAVETRAFEDAEEGIEDETLDTVLTLTNGAEIVLEGVTNYALFYNIAPTPAAPADDDPETPDATIAERTREADSRLTFDPLAGASDPNGDAIALDETRLTGPEHGRLSVGPDGQITYIPDIGFSGRDSFGFALTDGTDTGLSRIVTVDVTDDPLSGSDGAEEIALAPGETGRAWGNGGFDRLVGNALANELRGGKGGDEVVGLDGDDTLLGGRGGDLLEGGSGDDSLDGAAGPDTMKGGPGDDDYVVDDAGDIVVEAPEEGTRDRIQLDLAGRYAMPDAVEQLVVLDPDAVVEIVGNRSDNEIFARGGDDTLDGGAGVDTLQGGFGDDLYLIDEAGDVVMELAGQGEDTIRSAVDFDLGRDAPEVEHLTLFGGANTRGTGTAGANRIAGDAGANTLEGGDGGDTLTGGAGADDLTGEDGNDRLEGGDGADSGAGGRGADSLFGGAGSDTLAGGRGKDQLDGGAASDSLFGGDGDDTLTAGAGDDTADGGDGADSLLGGDGADMLQGGAGADTLEGGRYGDRLEGGAGADLIRGDAGLDTLAGEDGGDSLYGGDKDDRIEGNKGNDRLFGEAGDDTLRGGNDDDRLEGGSEDDWLFGGKGDDTLLGGRGADTLRGEFGADSLSGGRGADELEGGGGADTMTGGIGADVFIFRGASGEDTILNYELGVDQILTDAAPVLIEETGGDTRIVFGDGDAVTLIGLTGAAPLDDDILLLS